MKNDGTDKKESSTFCSGSVDPKSTSKVEFTVILDGLCNSGDLGTAWSDVCGFEFLAQ